MSEKWTEPPALLTLDLIIRFYLPVSKRTLHRMLSTGEFPPADWSRGIAGRRLRMWRRETVERWKDGGGGQEAAA